MRVGWLHDAANYVGGAELTMSEFAQAAPEKVTLTELQPGQMEDCDRYVIGNCVMYTLEDLKAIGKRPTVKYWHDVGPHIQPEVKDWLAKHSVQVCCSPVQVEYMGITANVIPPPVDLERFRAAAAKMNGDRRGAVSVGSWRNFGKAAHRVSEWAARHEPVDFYGDGVFAPEGSRPVEYRDMPELLARYERFVFLPTVIEPFGRLVVEAWAAGCEVVTNRLVGARWWIEEQPGALETAAEDFWRVVLS